MLSGVHSRVVQVLLTVLIFAAAALHPYAQDVQMVPDQTDRDAAEKAQTHKDATDEEPVATFKARTDLVQLFFNVKDKKGGLIPHLTKDDFEISDNKQPQTIK